MSWVEQFPQLADFVHVWGLAIANFFRQFNIDFPPATSGTFSV